MSRGEEMQAQVEAMPSWAKRVTFIPGADGLAEDTYLYEGEPHHFRVTDTDLAAPRQIDVVACLTKRSYPNGKPDEVGVAFSRNLPEVLAVEDAKTLAESLLAIVATSTTPVEPSSSPSGT